MNRRTFFAKLAAGIALFPAVACKTNPVRKIDIIGGGVRRAVIKLDSMISQFEAERIRHTSALVLDYIQTQIAILRSSKERWKHL